MSKTVDERIVRMQLDNQNFETNAKATMSTLDKLKQALNFKGAANGVKEIDSAVKSVNVNTLSSAVDTVAKRFSNLGIIGVTALQNITNQAINTAKNLVNQLTLAPITSGFAEYETQIGAIQTILANTSAQGTTLNQVNAALDELNTYADKTIYNFTEMTRNIGTFTAAGVDLKTSTEAIKGIANLAAMSGSTSAQASTAMYQLSQALAAGRVSLQDWNSVVNAGMGGKVFQEALMQTAETMGIAVDRSVSFRESISAAGGKASWLTSDVLLQTLRQFTGDLTDAELAAQGFNEEQIAAIQAQAKTANEAATQVKTLTQLFDTAKEAVASGWTQTWEIIVGDFNEAKELFTEISNVFGEFVNQTSEARNNLLSGGLMSGWKQFLNEGITNSDDFIQSIRNISKEYGVSEDQIDSYIETYGSFEKSLKAGWMTTDILAASVEEYATRLSNMSEEEREAAGYTQKNVDAINELNNSIKDGSVNLDEFVAKMNRQSGRENIIEGLAEAFRVLQEVISPIGEAFDNVFKAITPDQLYNATVAFRDFFKNLSFGEENANNLRDTFEGLFSIVDIGKKVISEVFNVFKSLAPSVGNLASDILSLTGAFGRWLTGLNDTVQSSDAFTAAGDAIVYVLSSILDGVHAAIDGFFSLISFLGEVGNAFSGVFGGIKDVVGSVFTWIGDNVTLGDIFAGISAGGIVSIAKDFKSFTDTIKDALNFKDFFKGAEDGATSFKTILSDIHDSLVAFQEGIRVASLLAIAGAVTLMVSSLRKITELTPDQILGGIVSLRILVAVLNSAFKSLLQTLKIFSSKGVLSSAAAMVVMAKAVDILADAMVEIGSLNFNQIISGLIGVGGGLAELVAAVRLIGGSKGVSLKDSVALLALAEAMKILSEAMIPLSQLSWDEIGRGLTAVGGGLAELTAAIGILSKVGGGGSILGGIGLLISSGSLYSIATNLQALGNMTWDQIKQGLSAMGGALVEFTASLSILSKVGGFGSILGGVGLLIAVQSLYSIATNLQTLGNMSWDQIKQGLVAMGGALLEVGGVTGALGKLTGFSGLLGGGSLVIAVQSLQPIAEALQALGNMTWDQIKQGLVAMGGALLEVGAISGALGYFTGLSGIFGAGAILIAVQGLGDLGDALIKVSSLTWDEIGRGLTAMGLALLEVGAISGALGYFTGVLGVAGAAGLALAITNLGDLADALQKFGEMSWDEIGRGLTAMGSALGEVALGSITNLFSFLGAGSLSTTIEPLGQLADAMKKWTGVTVPEGLDAKLSQLASGVGAFTLAGWGADALSTIAAPLGTLADSIKKWSGVVVPEGLGDQLSSFAGGINSFTLSGWGADSISTLAEPMGVLADSIKKWQGISISEELGTSLGNLADGVGKFIFSGWGADNLPSVATGMSSLSDAMSKWKNITIPEGLGDDLNSLASGVSSFTLAFAAGWSIDSLKGPLSELADVVTKWGNIKFPPNIGGNLTSLANGVKSFSTGLLGNLSLGISVDQLSGLADAVSKFNGVDISGVGGELTNLSSGITSFVNSGINQDVVTAFTAFVANFKAESFGTIGQNITALADGLTRLSTFNASSVTGLQEFFTQFSQISTSSILTNFSTGLTNSLPTFQMYATQIVTTMVMAFTAAAPQFMQVATQWGMMLTQGLNSQTPMAVNAARTLGTSAKIALSNLKPQFKVAGQNAGAGFVEGILEYVEKAAEAAAQVAQAAVDSMNRTLDSQSPSRVMTQSGEWGGEGFVIGLLNLVSSAKNAGTELADGAIDSITEAIGRARDVFENTEATQPTIRPVVDLSDVSSKARAINQTFSSNRRFSVGVTASKVASASAGFSSGQNGISNSESTSGGSSKVNNISFTQNNYSPKALSRSEIYRDTSNQFSMLKEAVFAK